MPQTVNVDTLPDQNGPIARGVYKVWVREVKQEPSGKGYCMDEFDCEILSPDTVKVGDEDVSVAGRTFSIYQTYSVKTLKRAKENLIGKLGIKLPLNSNGHLLCDVPSEDETKSGAYKRIPEIQDVTLGLRRKAFMIELSSEPYYKTDTGNWKGEPILDEHGNKQIAGYKIVADLSSVKSTAKDDEDVPGF